ncbi:MAG: hypothetical protein A2X81_05185 [Desulfobacterales bacterium GWB2_56_26]|nr:MAG: hypothetical protein A2X81_05185 [Desulfobacterales bacterium GWB2_56_26]
MQSSFLGKLDDSWQRTILSLFPVRTAEKPTAADRILNESDFQEKSSYSLSVPQVVVYHFIEQNTKLHPLHADHQIGRRTCFPLPQVECHLVSVVVDTSNTMF